MEWTQEEKKPKGPKSSRGGSIQLTLRVTMLDLWQSVTLIVPREANED